MKKIFPVIGGALLAFSCAGGDISPLVVEVNNFDEYLYSSVFSVNTDQEVTIKVDLSKLPGEFTFDVNDYVIACFNVDDEDAPSYNIFGEITSFKWNDTDITPASDKDHIGNNQYYVYDVYDEGDGGEQFHFVHEDPSKYDEIAIVGKAKDNYENTAVAWSLLEG